MGQSDAQISLTRTMAASHNYINIYKNQSGGRCVVMDLLHFGLRCDYFPVLPCTWHRANQSQFDQVYSGHSGVRGLSKFFSQR